MRLEEAMSMFGVRHLISPTEEADVRDLTGEEEASLEYTFGNIEESIADVSPKLAKYWRRSYDAYKLGAGVLKALTGKTFATGRADDIQGALRARPIIPEDFDVSDFSIDIIAGTANYLWGGSTTYFTPSSTVNKNAVIVVAENGILSFDEKMFGQQWQFIGEKNTYAPFAAPPTYEQSIETDRLVYVVYTPAPMLLPPTAGSKLQFMPEITATGRKYNILGMTFYEDQYYTSPTNTGLVP